MKILILIDFSNKATSALNYSLTLLKGKRCAFYLLSVLETSSFISDDLLQSDPKDSLYDSLILKNKDTLDELVLALERQYIHEDFTFKTIAYYNKFTNAINQVIRNEKINLIVMGKNGGGVKEFIMGSHSLQVIRKVPAPVLIIPTNYVYNKLEKILLILESKQVFDSSKLELLAPIIKGTQIIVTSLQAERSNDQGQLKAQSEPGNTSFGDLHLSYQTIAGVPFIAAVSSMVQIQKPDLLAIEMEKEDFMERFFHTSKVSSIIKETMIPVLILHPVPGTK